MKIETKIEKLRLDLHQAIEEYGVNSSIVTGISQQLDELVVKYYGGREERKFDEYDIMFVEYKVALEKIKQLTREFGEFPSVAGWNNYAKENIYMSATSIEYISGLNWHQLERKILKEN